MSEDKNDRRSGSAPAAEPAASDPEYKVGPGRPPREYHFKPGQSGNPRGAKRKPPPIVPDLKAAFERALNKPIKLKQGEKERMVTMAAAGIEQLVAQFAKGDRHARRDLFALAEKFGLDLLAGQHQAIEEKTALQLGALDQAEPNSFADLTDEDIRDLSDEELTQLISIYQSVKRRRMERANTNSLGTSVQSVSLSAGGNDTLFGKNVPPPPEARRSFCQT